MEKTRPTTGRVGRGGRSDGVGDGVDVGAGVVGVEDGVGVGVAVAVAVEVAVGRGEGEAAGDVGDEVRVGVPAAGRVDPGVREAGAAVVG